MRKRGYCNIRQNDERGTRCSRRELAAPSIGRWNYNAGIVIFVIFSLEMILYLTLASGEPSGFLSIDCGSPVESHVIPELNITFVSDSEVMKFGEIMRIDNNVSDAMYRKWNYLFTLRTFPKGRRHCYTLQPVTPGSKYLIRSSFNYDNFDGLNSFPPFDFYLENAFAQTILEAQINEFIVMPTRSYVTLCLCKTNERDPFISAIELRPVPDGAMYPVNATLALRVVSRNNWGSPIDEIYRYPDDVLDRIWVSLKVDGLVSIDTSLAISLEADPFMPPLKVMQTANINAESSGTINWSPFAALQLGGYYFMCIHFAELKKLEANETREFTIALDDVVFHGPMTPLYLTATNVCSPDIYRLDGDNRLQFIPTNRSTLSPIANAIEFYAAVQLSSSFTDEGDANSLLDIRNKYQITKPWTGDPCLPLNYTWEGLVCSNDTSSPRVISLDLSNSGLSGEIDTSLANLTAIVWLNLASNNLTGSIPDFLHNLTQLRALNLSGNSLTGAIPDSFANLPQLRVLDLSDNNLNGSLPDILLRKKRNGSLDLRIWGNQVICSSGACDAPQRKSRRGIIIGLSVSAAVVFLLVASSVIVVKTRKRDPAQNEKFTSSRAFTFSEVVRMTDNFKQKIGEGGYGPVFCGHLCGQDVAVKILSHKSSQGSKEFYNEVELLSRVHHRNLVSFLGYCAEAEHKILIYEYLPKGNLLEILSGKAEINLSWNQRLQIALDAAQGLEYLHSGCKPAIIHRDVKSTNILLNDNLEAKLADFGVSKSGMSDGVSHVSTAVVGTPGYLDPEYSLTNWLTEKSDVYSFGVVLLELISGQQTFMVEPSGTRIRLAEWVRRHLIKGNHENVADPNLDGRYNVHSFWRVADVALECTLDEKIKRPSMNDVVIALKEAIALCNTVLNSESSNNIAQQKANMSSCNNNPIYDEEIQASPPPR